MFEIKLFDMFPFAYMLAWGVVMYLFERDKLILNRSLVASMDYIYKGSDQDLKSWKDLLPGYSSQQATNNKSEAKKKS